MATTEIPYRHAEDTIRCMMKSFDDFDYEKVNHYAIKFENIVDYPSEFNEANDE